MPPVDAALRIEWRFARGPAGGRRLGVRALAARIDAAAASSGDRIRGSGAVGQEEVPMAVKAIPEGYTAVTPYLIVDGAARAIDFYTRAFGARELFRMGAPGDKVGHAELQIGDSRIMLADEFPEMGARSPKSIGGTPVSLLLYVTDVDAVVPRAVAAGAKVVQPIQDKFYGDRSGNIEDPFGHKWTIATHKEDVSPEELERRARAAHGQGA
jgi:PhnB protein